MGSLILLGLVSTPTPSGFRSSGGSALTLDSFLFQNLRPPSVSLPPRRPSLMVQLHSA